MDRIDLRCVLDEKDVIIEASSPSSLCAAEVGGNFLQAISDMSLRELFRMIIARVRETGQSMIFSLRCDTAELKRLSYVRVGLHQTAAGSRVEVVNGTLQETKHRIRLTLLDDEVPRGPEILMICSWCKQVKLAGGRWVEVEEAMQELQLFEQRVLPRLSHGMCPTCAEAVRADMLRQVAASGTPRSRAGA